MFHFRKPETFDLKIDTLAIRRKFFILFTFLAVFTVPGFAQPKLVLPHGRHFELGTVMEDEKIEREITVFNAGTDTLIIDSVRTSCGCTVAKPTSDHIAPNDSISIHVTINSKNFVDGPVNKEVHFTSNDSLNRTVDVAFSGLFRYLLEFVPTYIRFGQVEVGGESKQTVIIKNNSDTTIIIDSVKSPISQINTIFHRISIAPADSSSFMAIFKADKPGNAVGQLSIYSNYSRKPLSKLSYLAFVPTEHRQSEIKKAKKVDKH